ncbi:hypothetical protein MT349_13620 [Rathayibacter caricis]|uniref:hypothetical protein n=1 Tax=Rathayibacter caricis TaxID=110936 RepID=UPI001FB42976|nr:hypothetical protein [Rathayibacter caricis]MCJ1696817.1 hypothetical protein [Rathayibacter caricis]
MTDTQKFRQVGEASAGWEVPLPDGVHRRTLVRGAAWTVPVVALAVATPAAAASLSVTLTFSQPTYSGAGCASLSGVVVTATDAVGAPAPGTQITVVLPTGFTFADGSTTYSAGALGDGSITLPAITLPAVGGSGTLIASSGAAAAAATAGISATPNTTAASANGSGGVAPLSANIPAGSTAVAFRYFLAPNGDLYYFDGNRVATGVTTAASEWVTGYGDLAIFQTSSGSFSVQGSGPVTTLSANIPTGSTAAGFRYFLAPNGDLYYFNGNRVATGVTAAASDYVDGYGDLLTYQTSNGTFSATGSGSVAPLSANIPLGSTAVGFRYFLAPNGDLYYFDGNRVATGVTTAASDWVDGYGDLLIFQTSSGSFSATGSGSVAPLSANIPLGSTAAGFRYFLAPNGDLYYFDGNRVATGVTSAASEYVNGYGDLVTYSYGTSC